MSESGPSFYGEVLPVVSRAVDEEEDEEDCAPQANYRSAGLPVIKQLITGQLVFQS